MSKRIIFSVWSDLVDNHQSATPDKINSFNLNKDKLIEKQKDYAVLCGADYEQFQPKENNYVDVQFYKIFQTEKLLEEYDEVLYLDLDVIPKTQEVFFDNFDLNKVCVYSLPVQFSRFFDCNMNKYSKLSCKKSMLLLDNLDSTEMISNTGVFALNKNSHETLKFSERFPIVEKKFLEAKEDNIYPEEMSLNWVKNNEVFLSYILERWNVENNNIGQSWNFILDETIREGSDACYFLHQVNKDFNL